MKLYSADNVLRILIFIIYGGIVFLSASAPIIQHIRGYPSGENIYALFSPLCHQYPTRCFWIFDRPFALCARCTSGYFGIAIAAILMRSNFSYLKRAGAGFFLIFLAAIDPLLQLFGYYESNNLFRLITGLLGGYGAFMLIYPLPFHKKELQQ